MPKKPPTQPKTPSKILLQALQASGAGVHSDQRRKADPKAIRRDKSYKRDFS